MNQQEFYEQAWSGIGPELKENLEIAPIRRLKREFIAKSVPKDTKSVTCLGCGVGFEMSNLIKRGIKLTGYDISENALELAGRMYPGPEYVQADISELDISEKDTILLIDILEHIPDDVRLLDRCSGARQVIIITDYSLNGRTTATEHMDGPHIGHGGDMRTYGHELIEEMQKRGYKVKVKFIQGFIADKITDLKYKLVGKKVEASRGGYSKPSLFHKLVSHALYVLFKVDSAFAVKGRILCLNCYR